ncbi:hypothetical protein BJX65DRAFT_310428 [Aspergillus insuetus]
MAQPESLPKEQLKSQLKGDSNVGAETQPETQRKVQPKRVILCLSESDMDYQNPREFVDFYFIKFPSDAALDRTRHFVHYQPPSDFPQPNPKVHIVIDLETSHVFGNLPQNLLHEIYKVCRGVDNL